MTNDNIILSDSNGDLTTYSIDNLTLKTDHDALQAEHGTLSNRFNTLNTQHSKIYNMLNSPQCRTIYSNWIPKNSSIGFGYMDNMPLCNSNEVQVDIRSQHGVNYQGRGGTNDNARFVVNCCRLWYP